MQKGFSAIEVLIVIVIFTIITSITYSALSSLNSNQVLEKQTDLVVSILNEARSLTLSSKEASQYGVYLDTSQVTLFKGDTYSALDPDNIVTSLDSQVALRNVNFVTGLGVGNSVVFERLTGSTNNPGSLEIYLTSSTTSFNIIAVSATGVVK